MGTVLFYESFHLPDHVVPVHGFPSYKEKPEGA